MYLLAIETSQKHAQVALLDDAEFVAVSNVHFGSVARLLIPTIDELLERRQIAPRDLGLIVVDAGPGGFTGLRVGVTVAKTLAYSIGCPLVTGCSLEVCAARAAEQLGWPRAGHLIAVMDGLRNQFVVQRFTVVGTNQLMAASPQELVTPQQVAAGSTEGSLFVGPGVDTLLQQLESGRIPVERCVPCEPDAVTLARIGLRALAAGQTRDPMQVNPEYYRPNYAEERIAAPNPAAG